MKNALQLKQLKKNTLLKIKNKSQIIIYSRDSAELNAVVWVTRGQKKNIQALKKRQIRIYTPKQRNVSLSVRLHLSAKD